MPVVKVISHASTEEDCGAGVTCGECLFTWNAQCRHYDWLVVYDDFPRHNVGSIRRECEPLACSRDHTILVTAEPPSIKIYPEAYTHQFGHVLTTHPRRFLPHPGYRIGRGCIFWEAGYSLKEVLSMPDYPKTRTISTVCSAKQQRHTQHFLRYQLTQYLAAHLPALDWYGWGVRDLHLKYEALNAYRYHIAGENYINEHHWTDKIADPILGLCLTFYAGDPALGDILPPESFIPIPIDDPERALALIREALAKNEYERRLPAIREARRLIVEKYNFYRQIADLIEEFDQSMNAGTNPLRADYLKGRHMLRHNPWHAIAEGLEIIRYRTYSFCSPIKH